MHLYSLLYAYDKDTKMKILILYACLGGNRYKWNEVKEDIEVTAVELDPEAARLYQERFPNDKVIVADAHQYLLDHYKEFDFIWSSPPCPTHSRARYWNSSNYDTTTDAVYPDMKLYEEILFLQHYFKGGFVVENVIPYYKPLIESQKRDRHLYWASFKLPGKISDRGTLKEPVTNSESLNHYNKYHDFDFRKYKGDQKILKMARNLVDYEAGRTIFETYLGIQRAKDIKQTSLF